MADIQELSEAKRALLERYLRGDRPQTAKTVNTIPRRYSESSVPVSFGQQQLWLLAQLLPDVPVYTECVTIHLPGPLNLQAFERSVNEFVRRHEAWRTSFPAVDGQPVQMIHPPLSLPLPVVNLQDLPEAKREAEAIRLATEDAQKPFDLANGPLLRALLVHVSDIDHRLFLTLHHIIFDGIAVYQVLLPELYALYQAFSSGKPSPLPPLPIQYADYAVWQRESLKGDSLAEQLAYWKKHLAGASTTLELPTDRPCPAVRTYRGAMHPFALSKDLTNALKALSRQEGVTLYMTLVAAFNALLYRYTGQSDILIGTNTAGRKHAEVQGVMGFFLNTVVLRTNLSGDPTFRELLARVREVTISASVYDDVPFEYLVKELRPERSLGQNPLFQVMFILEPTLPTLPSGWTLTQMDVETNTAKFDLSLELDDRPEGIIGRFEYSTDLFDASTITRLVGHWQTLLEGIVADSGQRLAELPILTEAERRQILLEWNATQSAYPQDKCIHQLFETQMERTPDATAAVYKDQHLTYRELNARANQLAHHLRSLGVGPEVLVCICMERSLEMVVGLLGILKAGGAYVPLDSTYPAERLAFMLQDTQAPVLLTQRRLAASLPVRRGTRVICMDTEEWQTISRKHAENPTCAATAENLAYVIYTSGSTGKPKGVMIPHRGLVNYLSWCMREYAVIEGQGSPVHSPIGFDLTVTSLFSPLLVGQRVVLLPEDRSIEALSTTLRNNSDFSLVKITPAHLKLLGLCLPPQEAAGRTKALIIGGEVLFAEHLSYWQTHAPRTRLINEYGPTETVVGCCVYEVPAGVSLSGAVPIGRPIANTQLYILDSHLQPTPVGVPGELYIGGDGLARGYLNQPDLTAERFIAHPFSDEPLARLYKTGDVARYLPTGDIEFLGRTDHQVKVRGYRIELGEIETVLSDHPDVREATVVAREDAPGEKRLVAYVVLHEEQNTRGDHLRQFLKRQLPSYMVPSAFVPLEFLPLTANGKVDLRALPAPDTRRMGSKGTFVEPRTHIEEVLAELWAQVLQLAQVGIHDNFFELGGDSILSIQIIARAHRAGLELTPKDLFQHQTIAELARVVTPPQRLVAEQGKVSGVVPPTPIQRWFFEQDFVAPHYWNQAWFIEVNHLLDAALLEQALQDVMEQHDALCLRFKQEGSEWLPFHAEHDTTAVFRQVDLSELSLAKQDRALEEIAAATQASLNLESGPLLRAVYFTMGTSQPDRLLLVIHHLVVDGVSWRILLEDLETAYEGLRRGAPPQMPVKTTSFQQWAQHLTQYARSTSLHHELAYWLNLPGKPIPPLPVDFTGEAGIGTMASARTVDVSLSAQETQSLLYAVPKAYHTQINDVLLTALAQTFVQWTGERMLLVELEGHGRELIDESLDLSRTVGWFTTMFPVCLKLDNVSPGEALKSVKEQLRRIPNHGIGYSVLRHMGDKQDIERLKAMPQAQVSFNYLGQFDHMQSGAGLFKLTQESTGPICSPQSAQTHLLEVSGLIINGHLQITLLYNERIHHRSTIDHLAQCYLEALRSLIAHCQSPQAGGYTPSDFPLARLDEQGLATLLSSTGILRESPDSNGHASRRNLEDIYPLSPLQQGMLFHTLYAPDSGVYIVQFHCSLAGDMRVALFKRAWQCVMDRHAVFRTTFVSEGLQEPLQIVQQQATLPWEEQDWRGLPPTELQERLAHYLKADQARGLDLAQAPLMRFFLARTGESEYYFTWTHHHLLLDGWSWPLVFNDVFAHYEAFLHEQEPHLPGAPSYRDYIAWLQQQDLGQAESFWRRCLEGFTTPTPLPLDQGPGQKWSARSGAHEVQQLRLSNTTTAGLQALVWQQQLTLNTLIQGVWAVLLSRYSGEHDVVFGATSSGRPAALRGVEAIVGPCISTLPVRVQIASGAQLLPWLKELQAQQVEARQYEYSSLVQIQGWSEVPRKLPLFESLLVYENYPLSFSSQEARGKLALKNIGSIECTNFPLVLTVVPGGELTIQFKYDRSRLDPATITRVLGHVQTALESILNTPEQQIHELPLLTVAERQQILIDWNATSRDYPWDKCIHQIFESQVEHTPEAVAVVCEEQHLTYRELNRRANQLAHHLQRLNIGPEVLIGLCMERSLEMIISLLGILKVGAAYVPLDPAYPRERLAFMLSDTQAPVLLTRQSEMGGLPEHNAHVICLDTEWETIAQEGASNPVSRVRSENLAYILYTSGSTGRPKGVMVEHKQLCNYVHGIIERLDLTTGFSFAMVQPLTVDSCITVIFPSLCTGGCLHMITRERPIDAHALEDYFHHHQIDCLKIAPSHLAALQAASRTKQLLPRKRLVIGGEASPWDWVTRLQTATPDCTVFNHYGPTEATVGVLTYRVEKEPDESQYVGTPLGRPIANTQIYLLDEHLRPVPLGVPGELYIGGASVARGYLNRPELTAQKFISDPFSTTPGARLYKTGDLARYLSDGNIEFLGRIDNQIKIRGFRIELGEIEAILGHHPTVRSVMVTAREDMRSNKSLVAYVVLHKGQRATVRELHEHVTQQLPTYMVPSAFVLLEALPMTPHGKVDLRALPKPNIDRIVEEETFVAPTLIVQHQLAQIWEELLDVRPIGIKDDFFDLGGHSLLAARLVDRIEQVCGKKLPLATLFAGPTIEHLANALQGEEDIGPRVRLIPVQASGSRRPFFFLHGDWTGGAFYCLSLARSLGPDQPFYVLEPYRFTGLKVPPTFEAMAAAHIEALRAVQPAGPYVLGGFCNGGLVAYEVARQLLASGQKVDLLVLIDPSSPEPRQSRLRLRRNVINHICNLMRLGQEQQLNWYLRLHHGYRYLRYSYYREVKDSRLLGTGEQGEPRDRDNKVRFALSKLASIFPTVEALRRDWTNVFEWVASDYVPGFYPGKITFLWASEEPETRRLHWSQVIGGSEKEAHIIPGTHTTCRTEYLHILAECLSRCLTKAQATTLS